jgi:pheromone shutdown-related protein TraB
MEGAAPPDDATAERPGPEVPSNVTRLARDGREIFLVGTAHVSRKSVDEVRRVIDELGPDTVCVELDAARYETLADDTRWQRLSVTDIVRANRSGLFLSSLLFSGFQKRLGDRLGVRPGSEMLAGVEEARKVGAQIVLADRDIQATLMRCYRSLGAVDRAKVVGVLAMLPFAAPNIDEAQVEKLKERETMVDVMATFAREMPALQRPLIDERDRYLMASVEGAAGRRVVAIVGAAHVPGMTKYLGQATDRDALCVIPEPSFGSRASAWLVTLALAALLAFAVARGASVDRLADLFTRCALPTASGAALFSAIVGGGPVATLVSAALSPLTLVVPLLPLARIAGLVQAWAAPPSPDDGTRLRDDILVPALARKNRFLRALLVAVGASFGRTLGAVVGLVWVLLAILRG